MKEFEEFEKLVVETVENGYCILDNWKMSEHFSNLRKSFIRRYVNEEFELAGIGNKNGSHHQKAMRNDLIYWINNDTECSSEIAFLKFVRKFVRVLNQTCFAGIIDHEFHYAFYQKGSYYKKHKDQFVNDKSRKYSMVYYLNDSWNKGDGGELVLYTENGEVIVESLPGRLIFFESSIEHEVLKTNTNRRSITGWLKVSPII